LEKINAASDYMLSIEHNYGDLRKQKIEDLPPVQKEAYEYLRGHECEEELAETLLLHAPELMDHCCGSILMYKNNLPERAVKNYWYGTTFRQARTGVLYRCMDGYGDGRYYTWLVWSKDYTFYFIESGSTYTGWDFSAFSLYEYATIGELLFNTPEHIRTGFQLFRDGLKQLYDYHQLFQEHLTEWEKKVEKRLE
jgi:hypothetical protein